VVWVKIVAVYIRLNSFIVITWMSRVKDFQKYKNSHCKFIDFTMILNMQW
jgi:hypothetical protein